MAIPAALVAGFPPSRDLLLDLARNPIDNVMLREIASVDLPDYDDVNLLELQQIRDEGIISARVGHVQTELHMSCWIFDQRPGVIPVRTGRSGRQIGLFSCAALLRAAADPDCERHLCYEGTSPLACCLEHAIELGNKAVEAVARFLTWRCTEIVNVPGSVPFPERDEWPLLSALGLLIITAHLRPAWANDIVLGDAAEWVLAEEQDVAQQARAANYNWDPRPGVLINGSWQQFTAELTRAEATVCDEDVRSKLDLCAILLARDRLGYVD